MPHRTPLTRGHLWQLPKELKSSSILSNFDPKWEKVKTEYNGRQVKKEEPGPGVSLLPALSRTFASQLLLVAALEVLTVFFWQVILVRHHHEREEGFQIIFASSEHAFFQASVPSCDDANDPTGCQRVFVLLKDDNTILLFNSDFLKLV